MYLYCGSEIIVLQWSKTREALATIILTKYFEKIPGALMDTNAGFNLLIQFLTEFSLVDMELCSPWKIFEMGCPRNLRSVVATRRPFTSNASLQGFISAYEAVEGLTKPRFAKVYIYIYRAPWPWSWPIALALPFQASSETWSNASRQARKSYQSLRCRLEELALISCSSFHSLPVSFLFTPSFKFGLLYSAILHFSSLSFPCTWSYLILANLCQPHNPSQAIPPIVFRHALAPYVVVCHSELFSSNKSNAEHLGRSI